MPRRDRREPGAAHSPLVDLEKELRALERKRAKALGEAERERERRFAAPTRIAPGSWSELETAVWLERAA